MGRITNFFIATSGNNYRPPVLSYKAFFIYAVILLLVRLFLASPPVGAAAVESGALLKLINTERAARNLTTLLTQASLTTAAKSKSEDMLARDYFAHVDPDGNYVWGRITGAGYTPYKILGENLAIDFSTSEGMVKAWIDSPTHRANLLNPDFVDQGLVALFGDFQERYTNVTTSLFGALYSVAAASNPPTPAPTQKPTPKTSEPISAPSPSPTLATEPTEPKDGKLNAPLSPYKYPFANLIEEVKTAASGQTAQPFWAKLFFTLFGVLLLIVLAIDAAIIYRRQIVTGRSHSSYHFVNFFLLVIISILIWWW